jgi:23S rRNA pseudouridine1911/1915/1917 synthase
VAEESAYRQVEAWSSHIQARAAFCRPVTGWHPDYVPSFSVIDETDDYIVVDKPAPLQVHPSNPGQPPTLLDGIEALLSYELINGATLSIVNRLDRETSGVVLVAKNTAAAREFGQAMMRREFTKKYLAWVWGWPEQDEFSIDLPLCRRGEVEPSAIYQMQTAHPGGAASFTHCHVLQREKRAADGAPWALIACEPKTGRTHQIRVHLSAVGHPIIGDKIYGPDERCYLEYIQTGWTETLERQLWLPRHALHAVSLEVSTRHFLEKKWEAEAPHWFF